MSGFEFIVRPVVFPNIRPSPARRLPPEDDPEQGVCTMSGSVGAFLDLNISESQSASRSAAQETKRTVEPRRVYQKENDGTINKDNFIDTERLKKLTEEGPGETKKHWYQDQPLADNEEIIGPDRTYTSPGPAIPGEG